MTSICRAVRLHACETTTYSRLSKGTKTALRSTSVYQISKKPSSEKITENVLPSHSCGTNGSNALGNAILHPGLGGVSVVGKSLATKAARPDASAKVGSTSDADRRSRIKDRTGSSLELLCTCSSESSRYLPELIRSIQARSVSVPVIQGKQSERYLGNVIRFDASAVVCEGISGSWSIFPSLFYPILPAIYLQMSFIFSRLIKLLLTFTLLYPTLWEVCFGREVTTCSGTLAIWRIKSETTDSRGLS
jgi:hypothetical protein